MRKVIVGCLGTLLVVSCGGNGASSAPDAAIDSWSDTESGSEIGAAADSGVSPDAGQDSGISDSLTSRVDADAAADATAPADSGSDTGVAPVDSASDTGSAIVDSASDTGSTIVDSGSDTGAGPVDSGVDSYIPPSETGSVTMTGSGTLSGMDNTAQLGKSPVTANGKQYIVQANSWGNGTTTLTYNGTGFTVTGQTGTGSSNPASYPSSFIGNNNNRSTTDSNLPIQVSSIKSVNTTWSWTANNVSGDYNAAYDVWFTASNTSNINSPTAYLMLWLHMPSGKQPRGSIIAPNVKIAGITWNIWSDGQCISYLAVGDVHSISLDLNTFIQDAVNNRDGTIKSAYWLHDIFAGFEIWTGGTGLQSSNFTAVVQ